LPGLLVQTSNVTTTNKNYRKFNVRSLLNLQQGANSATDPF